MKDSTQREVLPAFGFASFVFFLGLFLPSGCREQSDASAVALGPPPALLVDAEKVAVEDVEVSVAAVGTMEAGEDVMISAEVPALVKEIRFEEGTPASQGDILIVLDDEVPKSERDHARMGLERMKASLERMEAELRRARALEENAQSNFERKKTLIEQGATTQAVFLDAKTNLESALAATDEARAGLEETRRSIIEAEAGLKIAEVRLENYTVLAPFNGVLGERFVGPGDYVDKGDALVRLVAVNPLKANFTVPERYRGRLSPDQSVSLLVEAWPAREFNGKVIYISPSVDPLTRSVRVKALVDNQEGILEPGFFCRVSLVLEVNPEAVVIPEEAVVPRGEKFFAYTVEDGKAQRREIVLGQRMAGTVEVREGLAPGSMVVTAGLQRVSHGVPVKIRASLGDETQDEEKALTTKGSAEERESALEMDQVSKEGERP